MNESVHRNLSAVLNRKSASVLLFWRRISPLIFRKRVNKSPDPPGSIWFTTLSRNLSSMGRSRIRNFFGKILNQKRAVASVPAEFFAKTTGAVSIGVSQGYANSASLWVLPAIGKLRYVSLLTRTPASLQEPVGVSSTISDPP